MAASWLEGLTQVRLGVVWETSARRLEAIPSAAPLAGRLRSLTRAFLQPAWLPGLAEIVTHWVAEGDTEPWGEREWPESLPSPATEAMEPSPAERVGFWIEQALVLDAWHKTADERARLRQLSALSGEWSRLRADCERLGQQSAEANPSPSPGRARPPELLTEIAGLLQRCQAQLEQAGNLARLDGLPGLLERLEQRTGELLAGQPSSWPPGLLARLQQEIQGCGGPGQENAPALLAELRALCYDGERSRAYLAELERGLPDLTADLQARVVLARLVVEVLGRLVSGEDWESIHLAVSELAGPGPLVLDLVRPTQPPRPRAWFEMVQDPTLREWRLEQAGLSVRLGNRPWLLFPAAQVRVPPPGRVVRELRGCLREQPLTEELAGLCLDLLELAEAILPAQWQELGETVSERLWSLAQRRSRPRPAPFPQAIPVVQASRLQAPPAGETPAPRGTPMVPDIPGVWKRLPPPPELGDESGEPVTSPPLVHWHAQAIRAVSVAGVVDPEGEARAAFTSWLDSSVGREWFHRLARTAMDVQAPGHAVCRAWLTTLISEKWCGCYPEVGTDGKVIWPGEVPHPGTLSWEFDAQPAGAVVQVERFAPVPGEARCVLSLGPRGQDAALDSADRLQQLCQGSDWLRGPLQVAEALLEAARQRLLTGVGPPKPEGPLAELLDALVQAFSALFGGGSEAAVSITRLSAEQAATLDELLAAARTWGQVFGLDILPRQWTFRQGQRRDQLPADEAAGLVLFFRAGEPGNLVYRVRTFGLSRGSESVRSCRASVSAGPPPAGFPELEDVVRQPQSPEEEVWLQRLRGRREASLAGTLDGVAVQLFVDFWGPAGNPWRGRDPARAGRFAEKLASFLEQELRLRTFSPTRYQDYTAGWLEVVTERGMVTGRVRRVLRPGLQDAQGRLRVPAIVQVE